MKPLHLGELLKRLLSAVILLCCLAVTTFIWAFPIHSARAVETVYITSSGYVTPSTAPIHRNNDLYTFTGNITTDSYGLVVGISNITIDGNGYWLLGPGPEGAYLYGVKTSHGVTITNLTIANFDIGMQIPSQRVRVFGCRFVNISHHAIEIAGEDNLVSGNLVVCSGLSAIAMLRACNGNTITGNTLVSNEYGIWLDSSINNTITGNNLVDNDYGILAYSASGNTITENNLVCNENGIVISKASDNNFYCNNFINNTFHQVLLVYSNYTNFWDNGWVGNYWSDCAGVDADGDGIGESPYVIDGNNTDNYPLIQPYCAPSEFSDFTILRVTPQTVQLGPGGVIGHEFTIAVVFEEVGNLSGLDVELTWNTAYLNYISHSATTPVEDYPAPQMPSPYGGILHAPLLAVADDVDVATGRYHAAFATLGGPGFSGDGTIFVMTFQVKNQSYADIETTLNISWHDPSPGIPETGPSIINGIVRIPKFTSDIAVTTVEASKVIVGQGYPAYFSITVENQGGFDEIFNLELYADTNIAATVENITVGSLASTTIDMSWDTSGWPKGNYTIRSHAVLEQDTDTTDNSLTDGWILITIPGDVDGDKDVDIYDVTRFIACFCMDWIPDPNTDIDGDGDVDIYDVVILCCNYGESW